ncbi:APC family permease [Microbacterium sp. P02]|uniref:APC family permease n=1 Tax=Microbacterium sp. P02 TaxID=3366260 RepID=UPI003670A9DA
MTALERAIATPDPVHDFGARSPLDGLDRRSVGFADVLAQSVAAVAPSAAATTMIVLVAGISSGGTVIAVVIATVIALLVARTLNVFARRMVTSGSLYTYAAKGLGRAAALAAGVANLAGYGFISMFALLGGAHYSSLLLQRLWPGAASPVAVVGILVIEAVILAVVLVRGIRFSTRVALIVELISVAIIVGLLTVLLVRIGPLDPAAIVPAGGFSVAGSAAGVVLALTAFVGFESSATLGVEARSPLRNIPRSIVWTVLVAGGLFVLAAYAQVAGFRVLGRELADSAAPVNELASAYGLDQWGMTVDIGIAASFLACAVASTTALTRVLFAMSRDGVVPSRLGRAHSRFRTPIGAVRVAVPVIVAVPIVLIAAGVELWDAMQAVLVIAAVGYIVAYTLVCVAAPVFLRRIGELTLGTVLVAGIAATALVAALGVYLIVEGQRGNPGVWIAAALAAIAGIAIAWRMRRSSSEPLDLGGYDEPLASEVLGGVARRGSDG